MADTYPTAPGSRWTLEANWTRTASSRNNTLSGHYVWDMYEGLYRRATSVINNGDGTFEYRNDENEELGFKERVLMARMPLNPEQAEVEYYLTITGDKQTFSESDMRANNPQTTWGSKTYFQWADLMEGHGNVLLRDTYGKDLIRSSGALRFPVREIDFEVTTYPPIKDEVFKNREDNEAVLTFTLHAEPQQLPYYTQVPINQYGEVDEVMGKSIGWNGMACRQEAIFPIPEWITHAVKTQNIQVGDAVTPGETDWPCEERVVTDYNIYLWIRDVMGSMTMTWGALPCRCDWFIPSAALKDGFQGGVRKGVKNRNNGFSLHFRPYWFEDSKDRELYVNPHGTGGCLHGWGLAVTGEGSWTSKESGKDPEPLGSSLVHGGEWVLHMVEEAGAYPGGSWSGFMGNGVPKTGRDEARGHAGGFEANPFAFGPGPGGGGAEGSGGAKAGSFKARALGPISAPRQGHKGLRDDGAIILTMLSQMWSARSFDVDDYLPAKASYTFFDCGAAGDPDAVDRASERCGYDQDNTGGEVSDNSIDESIAGNDGALRAGIRNANKGTAYTTKMRNKMKDMEWSDILFQEAGAIPMRAAYGWPLGSWAWQTARAFTSYDRRFHVLGDWISDPMTAIEDPVTVGWRGSSKGFTIAAAGTLSGTAGDFSAQVVPTKTVVYANAPGASFTAAEQEEIDRLVAGGAELSEICVDRFAAPAAGLLLTYVPKWERLKADASGVSITYEGVPPEYDDDDFTITFKWIHTSGGGKTAEVPVAYSGFQIPEGTTVETSRSGKHYKFSAASHGLLVDNTYVSLEVTTALPGTTFVESIVP